MEEHFSIPSNVYESLRCSVIDDSNFLLFYLLAYLIGSIPFGLIFAKISGHGDIRKIGSGNIGATNVLRTGSKKLAALTLLFDVLKSFVIAYAVLQLSQIQLPETCATAQKTYDMYSVSLALLAGFFAIFGHCFPIWLKCKGGKGVATALGALLAAVPYAGLAACVAWIVTAKVSKISSLSALIAVVVAPIVTALIYGLAPATICTLITVLVWIRHKDNIKRLLKGEEPRIGDKK